MSLVSQHKWNHIRLGSPGLRYNPSWHCADRFYPEHSCQHNTALVRLQYIVSYTLNLKKRDKNFFCDPGHTWVKAMQYGWIQSTLHHSSSGSETDLKVAALEVHTNLFDYTENHKHPCPWSMCTEDSKRQSTDTLVVCTEGKQDSKIKLCTSVLDLQRQNF